MNQIHWVKVYSRTVGRIGDYFLTCEEFETGVRWKVFHCGKLTRAGNKPTMDEAKLAAIKITEGQHG